MARLIALCLITRRFPEKLALLDLEILLVKAMA